MLKRHNQDTSKGKGMSKETSDESIEAKPEAGRPLITSGKFLISGKLNQLRTKEIDGHLEER